MKLVTAQGDCVIVQLESEELMIINNALNEICHGLDRAEFQTRVGARLESAEQLRKKIETAIAVVTSE